MARIESVLVDQISVVNSEGSPSTILVIQSFLVHQGAKIPGRCWMETPEGHLVNKSGPFEFTIQCTGEVWMCRLHTTQTYHAIQLDSLKDPASTVPPVLQKKSSQKEESPSLPRWHPNFRSGHDELEETNSPCWSSSR